MTKLFNRLSLVSAAMLFLCCSSGVASASVIQAFQSTGAPGTTGNFIFGNNGGNVGIDFNVTSSISVTSLGAFDSGGNSFSNSTPAVVTLYQLTGGSYVNGIYQGFTPVQEATVTLTTNSNIQNTYDFASISNGPLSLGPGVYDISVHYTANTFFINGASAGGTPVTLNGDAGTLTIPTVPSPYTTYGRYDVSGTTDFPASVYSQFTTAVPYGAGSFLYNGPSPPPAVPEPSSLALMGVAGLALVAYRRCRKTPTAR